MININHDYYQDRFIKTMKKSSRLFIMAFSIILASCSFNEESSDMTETLLQQEQTQQEFTVENIQVSEEPEFVIEADYDPVLAKKAALNKKAKTEETSPIILTSDDDDLEEDKDDLPSEVSRDSFTAYDYNVNKEALLSDYEYTIKGIDEEKKLVIKQEYEALFFVVAGAYKDENTANEKLKEIEALGYKVELISFDKEFKTICIAELENRNEANILAKSLQVSKVDAYVVKRRK